jgi:hypothetical protein
VLLALVIYYFIKRKSNRNFLSVNKWLNFKFFCCF